MFRRAQQIVLVRKLALSESLIIRMSTCFSVSRSSAFALNPVIMVSSAASFGRTFT